MVTTTLKSKQVLQSPTYTLKRTSKEYNLIGVYHLALQVVLCLTTKDMVLPELTVISTRLHSVPQEDEYAIKQVMWLSTNTNTSHYALFNNQLLPPTTNYD